MRKIGLVFFIIFIFAVGVFAETAFVKVRVCPYFQDASSSSVRIGVLKHSDKVDVIEIKGEWSKIKIDGSFGYVQNIFIGEDAGVKVTSVADKKTELSSLEVRKRASNFTSSAAAIRGLSNESVRDRENVAFKEYDFESIKWIENNFTYTEDELIAFSEQEFVNF